MPRVVIRRNRAIFLFVLLREKNVCGPLQIIFSPMVVWETLKIYRGERKKVQTAAIVVYSYLELTAYRIAAISAVHIDLQRE